MVDSFWDGTEEPASVLRIQSLSFGFQAFFVVVLACSPLLVLRVISAGCECIEACCALVTDEVLVQANSSAGALGLSGTADSLTQDERLAVRTEQQD